jgi:hypothetical protein
MPVLFAVIVVVLFCAASFISSDSQVQPPSNSQPPSSSQPSNQPPSNSQPPSGKQTKQLVDLGSQIITKKIEVDPQDVKSKNALLDVTDELQKRKEGISAAVALLARFTSACPNDPIAFTELARAHNQAQDQVGAILALHKAATLYPADAEVLDSLGNLYEAVIPTARVRQLLSRTDANIRGQLQTIQRIISKRTPTQHHGELSQRLVFCTLQQMQGEYCELDEIAQIVGRGDLAEPAAQAVNHNRAENPDRFSLRGCWLVHGFAACCLRGGSGCTGSLFPLVGAIESCHGLLRHIRPRDGSTRTWFQKMVLDLRSCMRNDNETQQQ